MRMPLKRSLRVLFLFIVLILPGSSVQAQEDIAGQLLSPFRFLPYEPKESDQFSLKEPKLEVSIVCPGYDTTYNDMRTVNSLNAVYTYIEESFGAIFMVVTAIGGLLLLITAISARSMPLCTAAVIFLVFSLASFLLRASLAAFFNDAGRYT